MDREAFFLPVGDGRRFCLFHAAAAPARGALLYLPPLAEEMNCARRAAALQARALAAAGYAVLQIDLYGCGDSDGDFADATWAVWIGDACAAADWLAGRTGHAPMLWGLRAGCLLAAAALPRLPDTDRLLFWQPVFAGGEILRDLQRQRRARELFARPAEGDGQGNEIVAGYPYSPGLLAELGTAAPTLPDRPLRIACLEVPTIGADTARRLAVWPAAGHRVRGLAVAGPAFWRTTETGDPLPLVAATTDLVRTVLT
jgi:exosortase A-associated hydrolase 2